MDKANLPLILEPVELQEQLDNSKVLIVDLCNPEIYRKGHLSGAVHLNYEDLIAGEPPALGLLPETEHLSEIFSAIGLTDDMHVVSYDDEGCGRAARLLWTLDSLGHTSYSLLNGGLRAWTESKLPLTTEIPKSVPEDYKATVNLQNTAVDSDYILAHLNDPDIVFLDTRTPDEYIGRKRLAKRGGHIPGAVNFNWTNAMDSQRALRLRPQQELKQELTALGVTPDKKIITYCQTHHRSAHTYIVLKSLGYPQVRGYAGSWSEWGNLPNVPVEKEQPIDVELMELSS